MAQGKLWFGYCILIGAIGLSLSSCLAREKPIGMVLLFQSAGHPVGVVTFNPDGKRGPTPGGVRGMSPRGGAEMTYMPDDRKSVPRFVDVEWTVESDQLRAEMDRVLYSRADKYSDQWMKDFDEFMSNKVSRYTRRIDLVPILTPDLIAKIDSDSRDTLLKLTVTFTNDQVDIQAKAYKWR